jgi:hypothetical protein
MARAATGPLREVKQFTSTLWKQPMLQVAGEIAFGMRADTATRQQIQTEVFKDAFDIYR